MTPTQEAAIREAVARALEPRAFKTFDQGYAAHNYLAEATFLNAVKVVKRTRKKAEVVIIAYRKALDAAGIALVPKAQGEQP